MKTSSSFSWFKISAKKRKKSSSKWFQSFLKVAHATEVTIIVLKIGLLIAH